ncbi:hypothetical protein ACXR2T_07980 [Leucobacter sp. HY1910]
MSDDPMTTEEPAAEPREGKLWHSNEIVTDNRTNEKIAANAITGYWKDEELEGPTRLPNLHDADSGKDVVAALSAAGRLREPGEQPVNNAGQLTDAQVEAAAQAISDYERECSRMMVAESKRIWGHGGAFVAEHAATNRGRARAAFVAAAAAAGSTPQAEAYDHCCQHPKCPGDSLCCCASEQRLRNGWNQWREEIAGDSKQAFRDGYQAGQNDPAPWTNSPALSSSTCQHNMVKYTDSVSEKRENFCSLCGHEPSSIVDISDLPDPSTTGGETWRGRIVTASFEDGESGFDCGLEDCECPEHDQSPMAAGTYVTIKLDQDERIGPAEVEIRVLAKGKNDAEH